MITPKSITLQEIKLAQTKTKITDMVAVRHPLSNGDFRTTLIILCEDGSLRMFLAAKEQTGNTIYKIMQSCSKYSLIKNCQAQKYKFITLFKLNILINHKKKLLFLFDN